MKRIVALLSTVAITSTSFANSVDCQNEVHTVLQSFGLVNSIGVDATAPNYEPIRIYNSLDEKISVKASASSRPFSWVLITLRDSQSSSRDLEFIYENCKVSVLKNNQRNIDGTLMSQVSASAEFCKNLNSGLQPKSIEPFHGVDYLAFDSDSGNIRADKIEGVKAMCKSASIFFK